MLDVECPSFFEKDENWIPEDFIFSDGESTNRSSPSVSPVAYTHCDASPRLVSCPTEAVRPPSVGRNPPRGDIVHTATTATMTAARRARVLSVMKFGVTCLGRWRDNLIRIHRLFSGGNNVFFG